LGCIYFALKCLLLTAVLMPAASAIDSPCTKTVRWYDDAPYSYRAPDGRIVGISVDIIRNTLKRMGCHASYIEMPWARALAQLEAGKLDILPGTFRTAQRERFAYFSIPAAQSPNALFLRRALAHRVAGLPLDQLLSTGFRLGVQNGTSFGAQFDAYLASARFKATLTPVTLRRNAWKMMALDRLDGMIADQASGQLELQQLSLEEFVVDSGIIVSTDSSMVAFSRRSVSEDFVAQFNRALSEELAANESKKSRR
jgi:polar amino acid transport system substrate-binding protein